MWKENAVNNHCKMNELLPIVAKLAEQYTAGESTSVTYEKAEQLMGAVLYCIQEGENSGQDEFNPDSSMHEAGTAEYGDNSMCEVDSAKSCDIISVQDQTAQQAYEEGVVCVKKKVKEALDLYNELLMRFDSYGNHCLHDTFVKGMPEFFKWYDIKYAPQDTILTLDYPVLRDLTAYSGIDRIYEYLRCIQSEQDFLSGFPREYVVEALLRYNPLYEDMIDNVCEAVRTSLKESAVIYDGSL